MSRSWWPSAPCGNGLDVTARWTPLLAAALALAGACRNGRRGSSDGGDLDGPGPVTHTEPIALPPRPPDVPVRAADPVRELPTAGATVRIAGGRRRIGSMPGEPGRDPSVEADLPEVEVPAFDIDALPYPNDPSQPAQTGVARAEAARLCAARGRRLCSEIEWELACRGAADTAFPGGAQWDPATCGRGELGACATREGVLAMGTRAAEWTRDAIDERAVIRGAGRDAAAALHRCATRRTAAPDAAGLEVAFRCCGGTAPSVTYPRETQRRPYREEPMNAAQIAEVVRQVPELEALNLREGLVTFLPGAITEVMNHGATNVQAHPEYTYTVNPVRWSPTFGEDILVLIARSRVGSWVSALYVLPDGRYRHGSTFVLREDPQPLALAYGPARREVAWATCWGCAGESGVAAYTEENRVVIVQR